MTPPLKWPVFHHATLDSTSDEARRMVESGVALPFVVRADRQTKGRGRGSNLWWSDQGSLLFTVALDPAAFGLETRHQPRLALVTAMAVIDAIEGVFHLPGGGIRWPNDVEFAGRKLAGVLPERFETPLGPRLLVGVGINVATRFDTARPDVQALAVSIRDLGRPVNRSGPDELLARFCEYFEYFLTSLANDRPALAKSWNRQDELAGRSVRVRQGERIIEGIGRGIDAEGALILETDHGLETIVGGQVLRDL